MLPCYLVVGPSTRNSRLYHPELHMENEAHKLHLAKRKTAPLSTTHYHPLWYHAMTQPLQITQCTADPMRPVSGS